MKNLACFILLMPLLLSGQLSTEAVTFNHHGCDIKAIFTKPDSGITNATIFINPGSGQNNKAGEMVLTGNNVKCLLPELVGDTLRTYRELAENLGRRGYATLRYDELFVSCPNFQGELNYEAVMLPAHSAINYLKSRPDVDSNRIVLLGHSEGAALINYVALQRKDVAALISVAGARTPIDSLMVRQMRDIGSKCGTDSALLAFQAQQIAQYFGQIRAGEYHENTPPFGGVKAAFWDKYLRVNDSVSDNYNTLNLPVLFLAMERDFNVPPSEMERFKKELQGDFTFRLLPGLSHYLTPLHSPRQSEMVSNEIANWLKSIDL